MSITKSIFCVSLPMVLSVGCAIQDWRHGDPDVCPVHLVAMRTEVVYGTDFFIEWTPEHMEAGPQLFPFAGIDYGTNMYSKERGMIYVCPVCVQARDIWLKEQRHR